MKMPLENGNKITVCTRVEKRGIISRFFSPLEEAEAIKLKAVASVEKELDDCASCPLSTIDVKTDDSPDDCIIITAEGKCSDTVHTCHKRYVMEFGTSEESEIINGSSYNYMLPDDVEAENTNIERRLKEELEEAVEFETNQKKYDNFGSW